MRLGEDLSGGLFRRLMAPSNPAGLWYALAVAVGLMVLHQLLQVGLAMGFLLLTCFIPDDHIDPRRSALFMARSVLRNIRERCANACSTS